MADYPIYLYLLGRCYLCGLIIEEKDNQSLLPGLISLFSRKGGIAHGLQSLEQITTVGEQILC